MSDLIPFDMQSKIIERLPVKSLIQFRSVSKQWMSFIDNPKFIKNYHGLDRVLEFRNSGEVVIELAGDDDSKESRLEVYEHVSRQTNRVGINGKAHRFSASSYMETLLLLDESDSVIH
nr:putative F-box domain-containing protein [Tanacetum cinerariifolium]